MTELPIAEAPIVRKCGACYACCVVLEINDPATRFHVPAFQRCQHQTKQGCGAYGSPAIPLACRVYRCMWLLGWGKTKHRPDRLGIVVECPVKGGGVWITETRRGALKEKQAATIVELLAKSKEALILRPFMAGDENMIFRGTGEQAQHILAMAEGGAMFRDPRLPEPTLQKD